MRHDGHGWDPKAPATIHKARAAIDKDGKVTAWHYETKGFSRREFFRDEGSPERTLAGQLMDWPLKPVWLIGPPSESYSFESRRLASESIGPLLDRASPLRTSHFRDPLGPQIHFGVESFIDELAHATNTDTVEFRLRYLKHPRDLAVVKAVAEKAAWGTGSPLARGRQQATPRHYDKSSSFPPTGMFFAVSFWVMTRSNALPLRCHWPETSGVLLTFLTGCPVQRTGPTIEA